MRRGITSFQDPEALLASVVLTAGKEEPCTFLDITGIQEIVDVAQKLNDAIKKRGASLIASLLQTVPENEVVA